MDDGNHTDCNIEVEEIELNDVESPPNDVTNSNTNNNNNNNRYIIPIGGGASHFNSSTNNTSNDNRYSSVSSQLTTVSSKKSMLSNKKELKQLRKPSDRIPSKSLCATFCYNIPRSTLMIVLPGVVILVTGAILTATTDRSESWTDGGVLLVSLVFLILGGIWTLGGLIYWLITWCRYKPGVVKRSQMGTPPVMTASATSASRAINGNHTAVRMSYSDSTSSPTTFESLNSPFTVIPHPIFSQQQLQLSQQQLNSQPALGQQRQQQQQQQQRPPRSDRQAPREVIDDTQQSIIRHSESARQQLQQNSQQLQQHIKDQQQNIREDVSDSVQSKKQHVADDAQQFQQTLQYNIADCYY